MTTTQAALVKSNRAFMALDEMGARLRFVSVDTGRVHGPQMPTTPRERCATIGLRAMQALPFVEPAALLDPWRTDTYRVHGPETQR